MQGGIFLWKKMGGTVESLAPEVKELTRTEMCELMEYIFTLPDVQSVVRYVAITHAGKIKREQEELMEYSIQLNAVNNPDKSVRAMDRKFECRNLTNKTGFIILCIS